jgi:hypothetical protein
LRHELLLNKIEIEIALSSKLLSLIIGISILIIPIIGIPHTHNNDLLDLSLHNIRIERILNLPGPERRLRILKQVLAVVHNQKRILLVGVVVVAGRVVDAADTRVVQQFGGHGGRVEDWVYAGVEAGEDRDCLGSGGKGELVVLAQHPVAVVLQDF